mgnify:CR=1 FL=1
MMIADMSDHYTSGQTFMIEHGLTLLQILKCTTIQEKVGTNYLFQILN